MPVRWWPSLKRRLWALQVGEISEPVKSQFGYHIILRLPQATENETYQGYFQTYAMNQIVDGWVAEAKVETTDAYDALDPKAFYNKMTELNETWAAEKQAEQEAAAAATASPSAQPGRNCPCGHRPANPYTGRGISCWPNSTEKGPRHLAGPFYN